MKLWKRDVKQNLRVRDKQKSIGTDGQKWRFVSGFIDEIYTVF